MFNATCDYGTPLTFLLTLFCPHYIVYGLYHLPKKTCEKHYVQFASVHLDFVCVLEVLFSHSYILKMTYTPKEDADQPGHLLRPIRVFEIWPEDLRP